MSVKDESGTFPTAFGLLHVSAPPHYTAPRSKLAPKSEKPNGVRMGLALTGPQPYLGWSMSTVLSMVSKASLLGNVNYYFVRCCSIWQYDTRLRHWDPPLCDCAANRGSPANMQPVCPEWIAKHRRPLPPRTAYGRSWLDFTELWLQLWVETDSIAPTKAFAKLSRRCLSLDKTVKPFSLDKTDTTIYPQLIHCSSSSIATFHYFLNHAVKNFTMARGIVVYHRNLHYKLNFGGKIAVETCLSKRQLPWFTSCSILKPSTQSG